MILHRLRTRGVGMPFRSREVEIDFDALPAGLVSIVGDNGSGKSHLLELSGPATLFRSFASYGETYADHVAPGVRDAFSELVFSIGEDRFRALVQCDPSFGGGRGKVEGYLFRASGSDWTPIAGPLVRDFDAAIAQVLPSRELFLASVFACQGGEGSFFGLPKAARKDMFSSLLGLAHLQERSESARQRGGALVSRLERTREDLQAAQARATRASELAGQLEARAQALTVIDQEITIASADAKSAADALAEAREALSRAEAEAVGTTRERARLESERDGAQQRVGALTARLGLIDDVLAGAVEVRAAAAQLVDLDAAIREGQATEREAADRLRPLAEKVSRLRARREALLAEYDRAAELLEAARAARARAEAAAGLEGEVLAKRTLLSECSTEIDACEREREGAEQAAEAERALASERAVLEARRADLKPRRGLLSRIPGVEACRECPLTADARSADATLSEVEAKLGALPAVEGTPAADQLAALAGRRRRAEARRSEVQAWLAEHAPGLERLARNREEAAAIGSREAEVARIERDGLAVRADLDAAEQEAGDLTEQLDKIREELGRTNDSREQVAEKARQVEAIATAEAQRSEVAESLRQAKGAAEAAAAAIAALPAHDLAPARQRVEDLTADAATRRRVLEETESRAAALRSDVSRLAGEREALGNPAADAEALSAREAELTRDVADWSLLERSLGRDGVQALAIDASGPTVSALANSLLASCYGPRFSISLETTAQTKDGKRQREVFDIRILDAEAGREAKQGSGGEQVLLDEGLRLALAIFNAQRSGIPLRTLWRDETTGALSPENADRYVAMLRKAMELGGFERCLFVAHQESVWAQADARLFVAGGSVTTDEARAAA